MNESTAVKRVFSVILYNLGFHAEQIAIFLGTFSDEKLREIIIWLSEETHRKGRLLELREVSEKLHNEALKIIEEERRMGDKTDITDV